MNSTRHQIDLNSTGPMSRVDWAIARYNWYRACGLLGDTPQSNAQVTAYRRPSDPLPPKPHLKWYPLSKPEGAARETTVRSVATTLPSPYSRRTDADHARSMSARHPAENHFTQTAAWQHSSETPSPKSHLKWYPLSKPGNDLGDAITEPTANEHRRLPHRSYRQRVENAHADAMLARYQAGSGSGTTREFDESEHPRAERGQHNGG